MKSAVEELFDKGLSIPIYYSICEGETGLDDQFLVDEESMRAEFEERLQSLLKITTCQHQKQQVLDIFQTKCLDCGLVFGKIPKNKDLKKEVEKEIANVSLNDY